MAHFKATKVPSAPIEKKGVTPLYHQDGVSARHNSVSTRYFRTTNTGILKL